MTFPAALLLFFAFLFFFPQLSTEFFSSIFLALASSHSLFFILSVAVSKQITKFDEGL